MMQTLYSQKSRATKLISEKSICHVDSEIVLPQVAISGRCFILLVPQTNLGLENVQRERVSNQPKENKTLSSCHPFSSLIYQELSASNLKAVVETSPVGGCRRSCFFATRNSQRSARSAGEISASSAGLIMMLARNQNKAIHHHVLRRERVTLGV
jgi:hypothetical protein